MKNMSMIFGW